MAPKPNGQVTKEYGSTSLTGSSSAVIGDTYNNGHTIIENATIVLDGASLLQQYVRRTVALEREIEGLGRQLGSHHAICDSAKGPTTVEGDKEPALEDSWDNVLTRSTIATISGVERLLNLQKEVIRSLRSKYEEDVKRLQAQLRDAESRAQATQAELDKAAHHLEEARRKVLEAEEAYAMLHSRNSEQASLLIEDPEILLTREKMKELEQRNGILRRRLATAEDESIESQRRLEEYETRSIVSGRDLRESELKNSELEQKLSASLDTQAQLKARWDAAVPLGIELQQGRKDLQWKCQALQRQLTNSQKCEQRWKTSLIAEQSARSDATEHIQSLDEQILSLRSQYEGLQKQAKGEKDAHQEAEKEATARTRELTLRITELELRCKTSQIEVNQLEQKSSDLGHSYEARENEWTAECDTLYVALAKLSDKAEMERRKRKDEMEKTDRRYAELQGTYRRAVMHLSAEDDVKTRAIMEARDKIRKLELQVAELTHKHQSPQVKKQTKSPPDSQPERRPSKSIIEHPCQPLSPALKSVTGKVVRQRLRPDNSEQLHQTTPQAAPRGRSYSPRPGNSQVSSRPSLSLKRSKSARLFQPIPLPDAHRHSLSLKRSNSAPLFQSIPPPDADPQMPVDSTSSQPNLASESPKPVTIASLPRRQLPLHRDSPDTKGASELPVPSQREPRKKSKFALFRSRMKVER